MGYELLFKVGDDPLSELAEMDRLFKWSYRIGKLKGLFRKKRTFGPTIIYFFAVVLSALLGVLGVLVVQYLFL